MTNSSSTNDSKGMATVDSNLEWVRLAQRVPVRIRLDEQQSNLWPAGTTATVVITGEKTVMPARFDLPSNRPSPARVWLIAMGIFPSPASTSASP